MNRLQQLQDRDAAIVELMAEINDKVAADNRLELSAEETSKYDALKSERESLTKAIARETEILAAQKEILAKGKSTPVVEDEKKVVDTIRFPMGFATPKFFKGPEAKLDAYKSGQFLLASLRGSAKAKQWCEDHGVQVLSQNEGTNTAGGYLVNPEMSSVIIDLRETYGVFRRNCQRMPMSSDTLTMNRRNGGLTAYFKAEEAAYTDSSKSWNQVQLAAKKLTALTYWSNELDDDAIISLADDLASEIAYAFALKEDQCGFTGDGTSTYSGITGVVNRLASGSYAGSVYTAATGHTAYSSLTLADFHGLTGLLPLYANPGAKFYCSNVAWANSMERLAYAGGGNTRTDIGGKMVPTFLGYPVELVQVMNTTTTAQTSTTGIILFGNLSMAAVMGTRRELTIETSNQVAWTTDQIAIKGSQRFDINVHDTGSASVAGPVVALATPGS